VKQLQQSVEAFECIVRHLFRNPPVSEGIRKFVHVPHFIPGGWLGRDDVNPQVRPGIESCGDISKDPDIDVPVGSIASSDKPAALGKINEQAPLIETRRWDVDEQM
jgi:hypothetical protein